MNRLSNLDARELKILPWVTCLTTLVVYLSLPTRNYYWDGIAFSQQIEDASKLSRDLIHPNHLIYTAIGFLDYRLLHALGFRLRALTALRITNSVLSAASAYVLFEILMVCLSSAYLSCLLTLAFAFAATWWKFSTDANSYVLSVLFLLLCFRLVLPGRSSDQEGIGSGEPGKGKSCRPLLLAVAHTAAMLFHELAVLFYPAAVLGLLQQTSALSRRRRLFVILEYSASAFLITAAAYYSAFYWVQGESGEHGFHSFLSWITYHSPDVTVSWHGGSNTFYSLRGNLRLFLGGRPSWTVREWPAFTIGMASILVILLSTFVYRLARHWSKVEPFLQRAPGVNSKFKPLAALATVWIFPYLVFLFFWLPANTFYRLFYLPALVLLAGIFLSTYEKSLEGTRRYQAALLLAAMALSNLTFDVFPNSQVKSNPPLAFAVEMGRIWDQQTSIYYGTFNADNWTIRYFNPETKWKQWPADLASLEVELRQIRQTAGSAWLDTTARDLILSTRGGCEWLAAHTPDSNPPHENAAGIQKKVVFESVNNHSRIIFQKIGSAAGFPGSATCR